jgi:hypothetical protein
MAKAKEPAGEATMSPEEARAAFMAGEMRWRDYARVVEEAEASDDTGN